MIDLLREHLISPAEATKFFPRVNGHKAHVSRIYRYMKRGLRGVVLESVQAGSLRCTSLESIRRFQSRLSALNGIKQEPPATHASKEAVENYLEASGL